MIKILVVCEAEADFRMARDLADRVCKERAPEWVADTLEYLRTWCGIEKGTDFSLWHNIKYLAQQHNIRVVGRKPHGSADYAQARKALLLAHKEKISTVILMRDADTQGESRRLGLDTARKELLNTLTIIIGLADSKREAWVLNGFIPCNDKEQQRLQDLNKELGFDACLEAHRLRTVSQEGSDVRHIKKSLETLIHEGYDRECQCWQETELKVLFERGQTTGLADYLQELEGVLIKKLEKSSF